MTKEYGNGYSKIGLTKINNNLQNKKYLESNFGSFEAEENPSTATIPPLNKNTNFMF
jgi:hypothetical protein